MRTESRSAPLAPASGRLARLAASAAAWAAGRNWIARAPLVVWLAWIGVHQFGNAEYAADGAVALTAPPLVPSAA